MSRSEFRFNKKRKHYSYVYKDIDDFRENILISSKPNVTKHKKGRIKILFNNIPLTSHPNKLKQDEFEKKFKKGEIDKIPTFYLIPRNYVDNKTCFDDKVLENWVFNINDKRKVKRLKKHKK